MEAVLAEMELANKHLQTVARDMIAGILDNGRTATREQTAARLRAQLSPTQSTIGKSTRAKKPKPKDERLTPEQLYNPNAQALMDEQEEDR